jgi:hypothetical protein
LLRYKIFQFLATTKHIRSCTLHRIEDLHAARQILLPHVDLAESLLTICALSTYNTCTQVCKPLTIMHREFTFNHMDLITSTKPSSLLTLPSYLFILYNIGLNMGKHMGLHPFPITLTQNSKRAAKVGQDPVISASPGTPSLTGCRCPKTVKYDQVFLKTWSRANKTPTLTCDSSRVTLV